MTLYVYRDDLEGERYGYYGVNLYFCWMGDEMGTPEPQRTLADSFDIGHVFDIARALSDLVKGKGHNSAVSAITKWINTAAPIVQFFRNCIDGGTGQNRCLALAKTAGIKYRRQNALALYKTLQLEKEFSQKPTPPGKPSETTIDPPFDLYTDIQEYFAEQLTRYMGMEYAPNDLSEEWSDDNDMEHGDFVFEIGEKKTATFRYLGHYHGDTARWNPLKMFDDFNMQPVNRLLRRINAEN